MNKKPRFFTVRCHRGAGSGRRVVGSFLGASRMRTSHAATICSCVLALLLQLAAGAASASEMTEEQVAAARDEALSKLEKPLEKMKIKELMALLEERGLECKDCQGAEKSVIVGQVV